MYLNSIIYTVYEQTKCLKTSYFMMFSNQQLKSRCKTSQKRRPLCLTLTELLQRTKWTVSSHMWPRSQHRAAVIWWSHHRVSGEEQQSALQHCFSERGKHHSEAEHHQHRSAAGRSVELHHGSLSFFTWSVNPQFSLRVRPTILNYFLFYLQLRCTSAQ